MSTRHDHLNAEQRLCLLVVYAMVREIRRKEHLTYKQIWEIWERYAG